MPPRPDLIELAKERRGQIIVPSGALLGLDAVTAAAEGRIHSVRLITRKPPRSLAGAPYLVANSISVEGLNAPRLVFSGSARAPRRDFLATSMWRRCWRSQASGRTAPGGDLDRPPARAQLPHGRSG
jgi:hypothetical protein